MTTPHTFRFQDQHRYPVDNVEDFEWWLTTRMPVIDGWTYLPITWTAYYKKNGYGKYIQPLQDYLNSLDRSKRYFSICQYDDGILNDVGHLDLRQYNMGAPGHYQLPLICQPHAYDRPHKKDIFCSFVGRITHPIRQTIVDQLKNKPGYFIETRPMRMEQFCEVLSRSRYVLAPRGYGLTSFRICEALQYGARPVYISDKFLAPHEITNGAIKYVESDKDISQVMNTLEKGDMFDRDKNLLIYQEYFTYESNLDLIIKDLKKQ